MIVLLYHAKDDKKYYFWKNSDETRVILPVMDFRPIFFYNEKVIIIKRM